MASHNVPRRLVKITKMIDEKLISTAQFVPEALPEHILWLAVIERALIDVTATTKNCSKDIKRDLYWFFFCTTPEPNNLEYICTNLIGDSRWINKIRQRVKKLQLFQIEELTISKRTRIYRARRGRYTSKS